MRPWLKSTIRLCRPDGLTNGFDGGDIVAMRARGPAAASAPLKPPSSRNSSASAATAAALLQPEAVAVVRRAPAETPPSSTQSGSLAARASASQAAMSRPERRSSRCPHSRRNAATCGRLGDLIGATRSPLEHLAEIVQAGHEIAHRLRRHTARGRRARRCPLRSAGRSGSAASR